jgi:hypothetical protein
MVVKFGHFFGKIIIKNQKNLQTEEGVRWHTEPAVLQGVAPAPGTPPEDGAARRNPTEDGYSMLLVSTALEHRRGACELSGASQSTSGHTRGRQQKRSLVMGRLRLSLLRHSIAHDQRV